ncbi:MAG: hypothetical protein ABUL60_19420 [Myxococcales bacterium]
MAMFRDRDTAAWQRGEMDDATFERRQVRWAWKVAAFLFGALAIGGSAVALAKDAPWTQVVLLVGILVVFGFAAAVRMGRWARFGARKQIIARRRQQVEANPAMPLATAPATPVDLKRFFGAHRRSVRYANWVLKMTALIAAIDAALWWGYGPGAYQIVFACTAVIFFGWSLFVRFDRRPYLDISAAGIWCRRWGAERLAFAELKAVYPRQSGANIGITLVPRRPDQLRPKLSWLGRLALRSGDFGGVAAHQGTLTIWTNRLDLPQKAFLLAVQSEVVRGRGV